MNSGIELATTNDRLARSGKARTTTQSVTIGFGFLVLVESHQHHHHSKARTRSGLFHACEAPAVVGTQCLRRRQLLDFRLRGNDEPMIDGFSISQARH